MSDATKGVLAIIAASTIWGLSGVYFKAIAHIPPMEVLAHRSVWSLVFIVGLFALRGRLTEFSTLLSNRVAMTRILFSAIMVSVNWLVYIVAIQTGHATEASLGYYIFPLVAVVLGAVMFAEKLTAAQQIAVGIAALAVLVLTFGLGTPPWIALVLALTFGAYGAIKKKLGVGPVMSVGGELALLAPPSLLYLVWLQIDGSAAFGANGHDTGFLVGLAFFTGLPLVFLSYGFQRLRFATLGLIQYLNPTLQLIVALTFLGEALTPYHAIALPLIWTGLALYSFDLWRQDRAARNRGIKSSTSGDTINESAKL